MVIEIKKAIEKECDDTSLALMQSTDLRIVPNSKIKVFISSSCGNQKYDSIRARLKNAIESTQLADVYIFEGEGASTLTAGEHYTFALEDSDVCIFLIDNADGVPSGVQAEVDTVKKYNIKALYYFCDEKSKEKTALEQSLKGARFAKSTTVHNFEDLSINGAHALINDITSIYHYYCRGKIIPLCEDEKGDEYNSVSVVGIENLAYATIPKTILKSIDMCRNYVLKLTTGSSYDRFDDEPESTCEIDEWCVQFLPVLFEAKSIKQFNAGMFLDHLKGLQSESFHAIVNIRWMAIQAYFIGDIQKCIGHLEKAYKVAKETNQPPWVINDILIDLRNQQLVLNTINNCFCESEAQKELTNSPEEIYYPVLDRIHASLHEKYIEGLYKKKIESPYTITFGSDITQYCNFLASSITISLYNGSLTHILQFYDKVKNFLFYLSSKYDDWVYRCNMLKIAIYAGSDKEVKRIEESYPEVLKNIDSTEAEEIMVFCDNHPISYRRFNSQLLALGSVGYCLSDESFQKYADLIMREIRNWLNDENPVVAVGQNIFKCLSGVYLRLSQNSLAEICCLFMEKHYSRWYLDMFRFMAKLDLRKMDDQTEVTLINRIINVIDNKEETKQIEYAPHFLSVFRNQDYANTETLDKKIAESFPDYYNGDYRLETSRDAERDYPTFVQRCLQRICKSNKEQGKNGTYYGHATRDIVTIRAVLHQSQFSFDSHLMDSVISAVVDTLIESKEGVGTKVDAICLLICIAVKYPDDYKRNSDLYEKLIEKQDEIDTSEQSFLSSNIDSVAIKIGLQFLFTAIEVDAYASILELMPYIQGDTATTIQVARIIMEYLELSNDLVLPSRIESIVLQNSLQWIHSDNIDIRWYATRILLTMLRNPENESIVNHQLLNIVDTDNVYIKNLIMRSVHSTKGINDSTKDYVISKCKSDANYVVRMVCEKENAKN